MAKKIGEVTIPGATKKGADITLFQRNSYSDVTVYLGEVWKDFLTGNEVYFSVKDRYSDPDPLVDVVCTVETPDDPSVKFSLSVDDLDLNPGDYRYQIQVRDAGGSMVKVPVDGRLVIRALIRPLTP